MSMIVRALSREAPWSNVSLVDEFNVDRSAPDPEAWYQVSSNGVNSFVGIGQLLAGNVLATNVRNRSLSVRSDYRCRTGLWESTFTVGDAVNTGLENTHGITELGNEMLGRGVYLYTVSGSSSLRFRSATGAVTTSANSGGTAPVGTVFRLKSLGSGQYEVYRNNVKLGATRTDPNGPLDGEELAALHMRPYHEQVSDRNAFGTQGWGSRVQRWAFVEQGLFM